MGFSVLLVVTLAIMAHASPQSYGGKMRQMGQNNREKFQEVFAWKQITYNITRNTLIVDRYAPQHASGGSSVVFPSGSAEEEVTLEDESASTIPDKDKLFIQYNNVPMGVDRWKDKLFVTMPRRRYGIPSTLNYISLSSVRNDKSPALTPYPPSSGQLSRPLVSTYRTRVDSCDRLWMVDTGMLEVPNERQQLQPPAIIIIDLKTDVEIRRYELKASDLVSERTPAGLASVTVDMKPGDCNNAFAYIPDLATYGLIVYSFADNDSWRVSHNFFSFSPVAGNLRIAGHQFQWSDGIFSIQLSRIDQDGFRTAYFHPMVSNQEFQISTRILHDKALATRDFHGEDFKLVGERGPNTQSTMHGLHQGTGAMFYAEVGRNAISCWNVGKPLNPDNMVTLAQNNDTMVYPADLHLDQDGNVWVMTNRMPRFIYSTLDVNEVNFRIFRGTVKNLIAGTKCQPQ